MCGGRQPGRRRSCDEHSRRSAFRPLGDLPIPRGRREPSAARSQKNDDSRAAGRGIDTCRGTVRARPRRAVAGGAERGDGDLAPPPGVVRVYHQSATAVGVSGDVATRDGANGAPRASTVDNPRAGTLRTRADVENPPPPPRVRVASASRSTRIHRSRVRARSSRRRSPPRAPPRSSAKPPGALLAPPPRAR